MFKNCCARPSKKISKSKSKSEIMDSAMDRVSSNENMITNRNKDSELERECSPEISDLPHNSVTPDVEIRIDSNFVTDNDMSAEQNDNARSNNDNAEKFDENADEVFAKTDFAKKRYSVDNRYVRSNFKRYSVDCSGNVAALEDLINLEQELARTNLDVRLGRRKSTGILKSTSDCGNVNENIPKRKLESVSDDDDVFEKDEIVNDSEGLREPPATPVGRDELALRRHRFFSDLVCAARAAVEHRVRFDPMGPVVAEAGSEVEPAAAAQSPAADLESLIERLERVTSRLERLPVLRERITSPGSPAPTPTGVPSTPLPASVYSPPSPIGVSSPFSPIDVPSPSPSPQPHTVEIIDTDNMSLNGYQDLMQGPLQTYLELSKKIGGDIATHASLVNDAFQEQLRFIQLAASRSKPSDGEQVQLLKPTSDKISAIQQYREKNRASNFFNHLSAISESIPALGWVAVSPTPAPYVKEMNDAGQFYTNRVLKEWKEKDKTHVDWCRAWVQLLSDLQMYVKQYHTTGLIWSGKGAGAPPPPPGGMPPPPPALPEVDFASLAADDRSALFAEINKGEAITNTLRKVTSEMQTHKNPQLRQGPAPFKAASPKVPVKSLPMPGAGTLEKPPVFMRDGKKWVIEYQRGNPNLLVENAEMNNVVYMFRCRDSALTVRGKINGVVLDSCSRCAVVFDNLVSSVEFVNCQSVQMQVLGKVPTVSIDKTDGCQIYLSQESLDVEIVSSKSSEMNVLVPKANGDYTEHPIPEQFKTMLNKPPTGLTTTPVESKG